MNFRVHEKLIRFILRLKNMLIRPNDEWRIIKTEETTRGSIITGYCAAISVFPPMAAIAERFIFNRGIVSNAVHSPIIYVLATNLIWYLVIILNMVITGVVITAVADREGSEWLGLRGLQLAVYSFTPLFLVSFIIIVPKLDWLIYGAIFYSIYPLYLGIRSLYGVNKAKAAWYAASSFAVAGVILGVLNMFEYMLESYIADKVFF